jgi:hypothetical protein
MPQTRMTGMENLLGGIFGVKRSQPQHLVGVNNVTWIAVTEDYDHVVLRNIKEARAAAKSGWVFDEHNGALFGGQQWRKVILIRRQVGEYSSRDEEFDVPGDIPKGGRFG